MKVGWVAVVRSAFRGSNSEGTIQAGSSSASRSHVGDLFGGDNSRGKSRTKNTSYSNRPPASSAQRTSRGRFASGTRLVPRHPGHTSHNSPSFSAGWICSPHALQSAATLPALNTDTRTSLGAFNSWSSCSIGTRCRTQPRGLLVPLSPAGGRSGRSADDLGLRLLNQSSMPMPPRAQGRVRAAHVAGAADAVLADVDCPAATVRPPFGRRVAFDEVGLTLRVDDIGAGETRQVGVDAGQES